MAVTITGSSNVVLQVKQTLKTDFFTTNSAAPTFVDITGMSVTITPSSASNKILVSWTASCCTSNSSGTYAAITKMQRNGTDIYIGDARGSTVRASGMSGQANYHYAETHSGEYLDSPGTTSAVTYKMQLCVESGAFANVGGSNGSGATFDTSVPTQITVMEIAG